MLKEAPCKKGKRGRGTLFGFERVSRVAYASTGQHGHICIGVAYAGVVLKENNRTPHSLDGVGHVNACHSHKTVIGDRVINPFGLLSIL